MEQFLISGDDGKSELQLFPLGASAGSDVVREGGQYKFRLQTDFEPSVIEPAELFERDPDDPRTGRFRPENHVGAVAVLGSSEARSVRFRVEVHAAKLTHDQEYRSLLEQVANHAAEAVLQGFAPSSRLMSSDPSVVGELDYRALAFIAARLRDERVLAAMEMILRSPHRRWQGAEHVRPVGGGVPAGPGLARQLSRSTVRRNPRPASLDHLPFATIPQVLSHTEHRESFDTGPNRFVKFVFEYWSRLASDVERRLAVSERQTGPQRRGIAEARWIADQCDRVLGSPAFKDVGEMHSFPHGDPVLLRQGGYRELLRVFAMSEASLALDVDLSDDVFSATQRNIATLYEYWCFLVLVRCLTHVCGSEPEGVLFRASPSGMSLVLQEGSASLVSWTINRAGRQLQVDLWFNQTFKRAQADGVEMASWASSIRPDASLRVRPLTGRPEAADPFLDTWVHFDAKFKVDLRSSDVADEDPKSTATRTDLLKMHAYRDLIRRSAGAYVLYPGYGPSQRQNEFHEILPGIGAFPLRPAEDGAVSGRDELVRFLDETLDLSANQASAMERTNFWQHDHSKTAGQSVRAVNFLQQPPADELVLVGYVRADQMAWVKSRRQYNLRADDRRGSVKATDRILTARLLLLWTHVDGEKELVGLFERTGPWQVASATELVDTGYVTRGAAAAYLVADINPVTSMVDVLVAPVEQLRLTEDSQPTSTTWDAIACRP